MDVIEMHSASLCQIFLEINHTVAEMSRIFLCEMLLLYTSDIRMLDLNHILCPDIA